MNALVIGGTGMLKDVVLWLNNEKWCTAVVARNKERMANLVSQAATPTKIEAILVDWNETEHLLKHVHWHAPFDLVIHWGAQASLQPLLNNLSAKQPGEWDFYHVKGSRASRPESRNIPLIPENCRYHEVILGFQFEGETTRWLTHKEISDGVIQALKNKTDKMIIGFVEPWEQRPAY